MPLIGCSNLSRAQLYYLLKMFLFTKKTIKTILFYHSACMSLGINPIKRPRGRCILQNGLYFEPKL